MELTISDDIAFDLPPLFRGYKDGRVERFFGTDRVLPGIDPFTGVSSKDVVISLENGISARLFKPKITNAGQKLPLLIYYHGGCFCFGSPFCATYHDHLNNLVAKANIVAVSVDYRLAPENPLPIAYEDSWEALKWVASHSDGKGPEDWLNDYANLQRVFVAGDSAGGNISHNMTIQAGVEDLAGIKLIGACIVHPGFVDKEGKFHEFWSYACPTTTGFDDPRANPALDPRLSKLGCSRVLVCVAENDTAKSGGLFYYESLVKSGWSGTAELVNSPEEGHIFHLLNPTSENAIPLMQKMVSFFNQE